MILSILADYLAAHPDVDRYLSRVDAALGRPVAHEGEAALSARLGRLARTGHAAQPSATVLR